MSKWEDIVRDKLEGYERVLPEGSLDRFRARREAAAAAGAPVARRFPLAWALAAAVAAGLAAFFFLRQPASPEDGIQIVPQPAPVVAADTDSTDVAEPVQPAPLVAHVDVPKAAKRGNVQRTGATSARTAMPADDKIQDVTGESAPATEELSTPDVDAPIAQDIRDDAVEVPVSVEASSPFIPDLSAPEPVNWDVGYAAAGVAGAGAFTALAVVVPPLLYTRDYGIDFDRTKDFQAGAVHYMPLKTGVSVRFPIYENLSITTGFNYSLYLSRISFNLSGVKKQSVQYLGIPVRLDGTLASNRWFDVYVGGGLEADYCLKAVRGGEAIPKGGFVFSLIGAGGIQFNITDRLGIYVEPGINLALPSKAPETYLTKHKVSFQLGTGLRININDK